MQTRKPNPVSPSSCQRKILFDVWNTVYSYDKSFLLRFLCLLLLALFFLLLLLFWYEDSNDDGFLLILLIKSPSSFVTTTITITVPLMMNRYLCWCDCVCVCVCMWSNVSISSCTVSMLGSGGNCNVQYYYINFFGMKDTVLFIFMWPLWHSLSGCPPDSVNLTGKKKRKKSVRSSYGIVFCREWHHITVLLFMLIHSIGVSPDRQMTKKAWEIGPFVVRYLFCGKNDIIILFIIPTPKNRFARCPLTKDIFYQLSDRKVCTFVRLKWKSTPKDASVLYIRLSDECNQNLLYSGGSVCTFARFKKIWLNSL